MVDGEGIQSPCVAHVRAHQPLDGSVRDMAIRGTRLTAPVGSHTMPIVGGFSTCESFNVR